METWVPASSISMHFSSASSPPEQAVQYDLIDIEFGFVFVVVEIITLYQVQTGRFLATTGYVAPSPNHVQNNFQKKSECISTNRLIKETKNTLQKYHSQPLGSELLSPQDTARATQGPKRTTNRQIQKEVQRKEGKKKIKRKQPLNPMKLGRKRL